MRILIALLITCSLSLADEYAVVFVGAEVASDSTTQILENIQAIGGDKAIIDATTMPIWENRADPDKTGKVCCIRTDNQGVNEWKAMPLPQVETRVTKDVRPPDKQNVKVLDRTEFEEEYQVVDIVH